MMASVAPQFHIRFHQSKFRVSPLPLLMSEEKNFGLFTQITPAILAVMRSLAPDLLEHFPLTR